MKQQAFAYFIKARAHRELVVPFFFFFLNSGSYYEIYCTSSIRPLFYSTTLFLPPFSTVCQHLQSIQSINLMKGWPSGGLKGPNLG